MKTHCSRIAVTAFVVFVQAMLFSVPASAEGDRITEQKILDAEKALDKALMQRNVAAFVSHLADDFTYSTERPGFFGNKIVKITRDEFETGLTKNLPTTNYQSIAHKDRKIAISQDGQEASVTLKNIEMVRSDDKDIKSTTTATYKYVERNDALVLTSLAESAPELEEADTAFAKTEFAPYRGDGPASLEGEAFVKTENGENRNCGGETILLAPYLSYDINVINGFTFVDIDTALQKAGPAAPYWRESSCDSQGRFEFTNVPVGTWIVITTVRWGNTWHQERTLLAKKITLRPTKNRISLTMKDRGNDSTRPWGFDLK